MKLRYGRIGAIFSIIALFVFGIMLISSAFSGPKKTVPKTEKLLTDYSSTNATVSLTTKGVINAEELHREIKITIGRNARRVSVIKGYQGQVIKSKSYGNSESAYDEFLHAINYAKFTQERKSSITDDTGACALGNRYVFSLDQTGKNISRLWSSTCSGAFRGTFGGNTTTLLALFQRQIPAYDSITQRVNLN